MKYNNERRLEKKIQITQHFIFLLNEWKLDNEIVALYNEGYSPLQIIRLWLYHTDDAIRKFAINLNGKSFLPYATLSDVSLSVKLKAHLPYTKSQHAIHLAKPQYWKIRCNHLEKTDSEVKEIVEQQLKNWASGTHERRRNSGTYGIDNTPDYWVKKLGLSYEDALDKSKQHKREKSPFSIDHWLKKGFNEEESRLKARKYHQQGGISATKRCASIFSSNAERQLYADLLIDFPSLQTQYNIDDDYVYDICLPNLKKIVEFNGTYWHADPRVYANDDLIHGVTAKSIWNRDLKKIGYAKHKGYTVFVVWELDLCKSRENTLKLIKEFLRKD